MPPELRGAFIDELQQIHDKQPPYKKDIAIRPFDPLEAGVDCSRFLFLGLYQAARRAGIVGISRVSASAMHEGLGGWDSKEVSHLIARPGDLVFWRLPQWHVGAFFESWSEGHAKVIHSSSSRRGPVIDPLRGVLLRELYSVKELTIGD